MALLFDTIIIIMLIIIMLIIIIIIIIIYHTTPSLQFGGGFLFVYDFICSIEKD